MTNNFDRIEAHLKMLFEQSLVKIFIGSQVNHTILEDLMRAMRYNLQTNSNGDICAPDRFVLEVPPSDLSEWQAHQDILDEMAESIHTIGKKEGFTFVNPPEFVIEPDSQLKDHKIIIHAVVNKQQTHLPDTSAMTHPVSESNSPSVPENALLVVGGKTNFPLEKPVINIGRHSQNDLVLNNLHVSRHHAQLRAINNQYVIFDVGSTGGTFLNERQISRATLQSGDVIRIGLVKLIYVQDSTTESSTHAVPVETEDGPPGDIVE